MAQVAISAVEKCKSIKVDWESKRGCDPCGYLREKNSRHRE